MDIALRYDPEARAYDLALEAGDLAADETLQTAVLLSLYTDRRAHPSDALPDGSTDRRGCWSDAYSARPAGSRLWLIDREKELGTVLRRAREYGEESLAWIVEDGIADDVEVDAQHLRRGVLQLLVTIRRGEESVLEQQYDYVWSALNGGFNGV